MYLFLLVFAIVMLIMLIFFTVVIGLKACSFLDGLAKKSELEGYQEGLLFSDSIFHKPNRDRKRNGIRSKLLKRRERIDRFE